MEVTTVPNSPLEGECKERSYKEALLNNHRDTTKENQVNMNVKETLERLTRFRKA